MFVWHNGTDTKSKIMLQLLRVNRIHFKQKIKFQCVTHNLKYLEKLKESNKMTRLVRWGQICTEILVVLHQNKQSSSQNQPHFLSPKFPTKPKLTKFAIKTKISSLQCMWYLTESNLFEITFSISFSRVSLTLKC